MEWINVEDRLPKEHKRFLGYCQNEWEDGSLLWTGLVEVYFDPSTGWHRCENYDEKDVIVIYWSELPELPK